MIGCVDEETLVALATGEADGTARAHVHACPACAARLAALESDLRVLRRALADEPLPASMPRPRRHWVPLAAAAAGATAVLALLWVGPWHTRARPVQVAQVTRLAHDVSAALFAAERVGVVEPLADSAYLEAALNGGWRCGGLERYGVDCSGALEDYE